jgi:hypothetical protein
MAENHSRSHEGFRMRETARHEDIRTFATPSLYSVASENSSAYGFVTRRTRILEITGNEETKLESGIIQITLGIEISYPG